MPILLFFSFVILVLTSAMAWTIRGSWGNPGQREAHFVLWLLVGLCAFTSLAYGVQVSYFRAAMLVAGFSTIGYFLDDILLRIFPEPPPRTPAE